MRVTWHFKIMWQKIQHQDTQGVGTKVAIIVIFSALLYSVNISDFSPRWAAYHCMHVLEKVSKRWWKCTTCFRDLPATSSDTTSCQTQTAAWCWKAGDRIPESRITWSTLSLIRPWPASPLIQTSLRGETERCRSYFKSQYTRWISSNFSAAISKQLWQKGREEEWDIQSDKHSLLSVWKQKLHQGHSLPQPPTTQNASTQKCGGDNQYM